MKERPILFSAPMVRAILDGTKTQTRRVVKVDTTLGRPSFLARRNGRKYARVYMLDTDHDVRDIPEACPYGKPSDCLWVRETWMDLRGTGVEHRPTPDSALQRYAYAANTPPGSCGDEARKAYGLKWRPSIHMPRAVSRIKLEITGVRIERLQDISEADAIAEGCTQNHNGYYWGGPHAVSGLKQMATSMFAYQDLWESINGPGSWDANPWVWVLEFKRLEGGAA